MKRKFVNSVILAQFLMTLASQYTCAKEPWSVDQQYSNTPNGPLTLPKYNSSQYGQPSSWSNTGQVANFSPDFLKQSLAYRINQGSILTGVMESTISSKVCLPGTIFSILLPLGYINDNVTVIPPGSKIIGVIMNSQRSTSLNNAHPGRIEISLQTLVFPSGKSSEFHGMIMNNVAHNQVKPPTTKNAGFDLKDYPQLGVSFVRSFGLGVGSVMKKANTGSDLEILAGTTVPIKITRPLDLTQMVNFHFPTTSNNTSNTNNIINNQPANSTSSAYNAYNPANQILNFPQAPQGKSNIDNLVPPSNSQAFKNQLDSNPNSVFNIPLDK